MKQLSAPASLRGRERGDAAGAFHQDRVTEALRVRCADLLGEVEAGVEPACHVAAGPPRLVLLGFAQLAETRPAGRSWS
jgi:hypothetical protein